MSTLALLDKKGSPTDDDNSFSGTPMSTHDAAIAAAEAAERRGGPAAHEIVVHRAVKVTRDRSFNASGSFVHFSHHALHNVIDDRSFLEAGSVRDLRRRARWYNSSSALALRKCIRSKIFVSLSMAALLVALFFPDLWVLLQVPTNFELDAVLTTAFCLFFLELVLHAVSDPAYPFSFFFFMDLLGTLSMGFDISYAFGPDATVPERYKEKNKNDAQFMMLRAARAARLAARAGRLSRVVKVLRFLSSEEEEEAGEKQVKMAKVISNKLSDVLSVRVAFLVICIAVVLPTFQMFEYPEMDESMIAWTQIVTSDVSDYQHALAGKGGSAEEVGRRVEATVQRLARFYARCLYGPFKVCIGRDDAGGDFRCQPSPVSLAMDNQFGAPQRKASILELTEANVQLSFEMTNPLRMEAAMNIGLILLLIVVMVVFSILLSSEISVIALTPLERLLGVVRQRCKQIFKYTNELQEDEHGENHAAEEEADLDDTKASEFALLEKAVAKLVAIAALSTKAMDADDEHADEHRALVMGWMQGGNAPKQAAKAEAPGSGKGPTRMVLAPSSDESSHLLNSVKQIPQGIKKTLNTQFFDALLPNRDQKVDLAAYIVFTLQGCSDYIQMICQERIMMNFVMQAERLYPPNPYHNFSHALDVEHSLALSFQLIDAGSFFTEAEQFWLAVAAIGHDLGHVGFNNSFLVEIGHDIAVMYNDRSPLENMHCSKLFELLSDPEANVFAEVEKGEYKAMRRGIIQAILHTDVTKHNEMIKELALLFQMHSQDFEGSELSEQGAEVLSEHGQMIANALLHSADMGNPMKPWELCQKLAHLILDEFALQGDREKELGVPVSMLNDREKVNRPNSQIVMAEFMMAPMVEAIVHIFPQLDPMALHLGRNVLRWEQKWVQESGPPEDAAEKIRVRVQKLVSKCDSLLRSGTIANAA
mmetsp:Transcript_100607/g.319637  ORF Transcript_100607/g.319637 Transcript_100607/m.319637 type:complete len:933 (-) Transcript_100607:234-3032(-)